MEKKTWVMLFLLFAAFSLQAQDVAVKPKKARWDAAGKADKLSDKLYRELDLTKEQSKKIYEINEDIARRRDEARKNPNLSPREQMQAEQTLNSERNDRFKSVLSPTQYKKWNDWEMKKKAQLEEKMDRKQDKKEARKATHP